MIPILCKLLLIGDSLIVGLGSFGAQTINHGIGGDTPRGVQSRIEAARAKCPKGAIAIEIGVNIKYRPANQVVNRVNDLLFNIKSHPGEMPRIYLLGIPACTGDRKVAKINEGYKRLAYLHGINYFEFPEYLKRHITRDCVHLTGTGYKIWKTHIKLEIKQAVIKKGLRNFTDMP